MVAVAVPRQVVDALLEVALDAGLDPVAIDILPLAHARLALNSRFDTGLRLHPAMPLGTPEVVNAPDAANGREGASAPDAAGARHAERTGIGIALDAPPAAASQEGSRLDRGMPAAYGPASNPASYLRQRNVCLVDLGASGTAVSIYRHGWLSVYRHLPQGGAALTAQIARSLNVDVARAEALKMDPPDRHELLHAAAPLLEDLVAELRRSINYYRAQYRWTEVDLMLLFGGGALMPGLDSYLARETGIPTQVYSSPLFPVNAAGAAGLALWVPADAPETASGAAAPGASVPDGTAVAAGGGVAPSYAGHGQPGAGNSGA
ncbi:MAG: pilus assembly protein PilM [Firmicutes bacterium]|nr:pilus assembly protein PilM [Bacillota bacterium]